MKLLLTVAAVAMFAASPVSAQDHNWSGPYVGVHVGGAWGDVTTKDDAKDGVDPGPFGYNAAGVFGGGTAGYNFQFDRIVVGVEGDVGYMDLSGDGIIPSASNPNAHQDLTLDGGLYGDVTARVGFAFANTLIYAKGGFAFLNGEANQVTTNPGYKPTGTDGFTGYTIGGGIEQMISQNVSLKLEYLHTEFGSQGGYQTEIDPPTGHKFRNTTDVDPDTIKLGVAYHF